MHIQSIYTISSVILVSLVSFIGVLTLVFKKEKLHHLLLSLVSLSVGTLLGGAFLHLLPEAVEIAGSFSKSISLIILFGILCFFFLDKLIHWRHSHSHLSHVHKGEKNNKSMVPLNLFGDAVHNFLDGLLIAGSYIVSIPTGIATTLAVIVHEAPQEIADFGVLLYSGLSTKRALFYNFLSALFAVIGAVIGLALSTSSQTFTFLIIPFAAGSFIYIAGSNLIPEILNKGKGVKQFIYQLIMFVLGIAIMYGLLFLE